MNSPPAGAPPQTGDGLLTPDHHRPDGGFRNPWPTAETREPGGFARWRRERREQILPPNPSSAQLPFAEPSIVYPHAPQATLRVTWVGHATFLIQIGGFNLLTDPHWRTRASPVQWMGPKRFVPPALDWDRLPPIDAVLLSHDHYDHLDSGTVRALRRRFGKGVRWFAPLGYRRWLAWRRVSNVSEMDWWEEESLQSSAGSLRIVAAPCQHWTSRTPWDRQRRLWCSWAVRAAGGASVYFGGDSGYFPGYTEIRDRAGPFDSVLLPIGAYEPRWFMRPAHMNPEEATQAYLELGRSGTLIGMHWGTWRLTDEDPLEPPERMRRAWHEAGLPPENLCVLRHGGTWSLRD